RIGNIPLNCRNSCDLRRSRSGLIGCIPGYFTCFAIALFREFSESTLPLARPPIARGPGTLERPRGDAYSPGARGRPAPAASVCCLAARRTAREMIIMSLSAGRSLRLAAACAAVFLLAGCGLFSPTEEPYVERPADELYNTGIAYMQDQQYSKAAKAFDEV